MSLPPPPGLNDRPRRPRSARDRGVNAWGVSPFRASQVSAEQAAFILPGALVGLAPDWEDQSAQSAGTLFGAGYAALRLPPTVKQSGRCSAASHK